VSVPLIGLHFCCHTVRKLRSFVSANRCGGLAAPSLVGTERDRKLASAYFYDNSSIVMRIVGLGLTVAAAAVLSASAFRPGGVGFGGGSTRSRQPGPTATRRIVASTTALGDKPKKKTITTMKRGTSGGGFGSASSSGSTAPTPTFVKPSFPYAGELRPCTQSPQQVVLDASIVKPDYWQTGVPKPSSAKNTLMPWMIEVKTTEEITKMRAAGRLARQVLDLAGRAVAVGVTTDEIDRLVHDEIVSVRFFIHQPPAGMLSLSFAFCSQQRPFFL
jgi:hypothetical protein